MRKESVTPVPAVGAPETLCSLTYLAAAFKLKAVIEYTCPAEAFIFVAFVVAALTK